jgi:hypothetical protein
MPHGDSLHPNYKGLPLLTKVATSELQGNKGSKCPVHEKQSKERAKHQDSTKLSTKAGCTRGLL